MIHLNLTDAQKRDILDHLEQWKPLPDEYRFLLFADKNQVELVRNGKTNETTVVAMPFQTIEVIDEPRNEVSNNIQAWLFDMRGRQQTWWTNKLIWWDNKLILSSLLYGPMREEIKKAWWLKLIYIDPPFDVGADFSMKIELGEDEYTKSPSILEEIAYRDTRGKWADSFISMIYERLKLMKDLLADDGSIYVHCDWRVNSHIRLIMDEVFGKDNFRNEIIWYYSNSWLKAKSKKFHQVTDTIYWYNKSSNYIWNELRKKRKDWQVKWPKLKYNSKTGKAEMVRDENGKPVYIIKEDVLEHSMWEVWLLWVSSEKIGYPTQKPENLLEKIIEASSNPWDLIADFFCWSWTTLAVAEKLGRKRIGSDLGKFGIHTTRKRMISTQRQMLAEGKDYRAFEILNLGQYERSFFVTKHLAKDHADQFGDQLDQQKIHLYTELITNAYKATGLAWYSYLHARKDSAVVSIWPIDFPVDQSHIMQALDEAKRGGFTQLHVLWFEFAMWASTTIDEAKSRGINLQLKYIPRDVFDKRVVADDAVKFFDVAYIEWKVTKVWYNTVSVSLEDFAVYYTQENIENAKAKIKPEKEGIVMENGKIWKIKKDSTWNIVSQEDLTKHRTDRIDYRAVDFDYMSHKETIRQIGSDLSEQSVFTGRYVFENEWQSFKTKKQKTLELVTAPHIYETGGTKYIAIKVVDIFGNDNMTVIQTKV